MSIIWIYLVSLAAFLAVDAVWLRTVMQPLFSARVGDLLREEFRFEAAGVFYALYVAGILYFATFPALRTGSPGQAAFDAALLGFLAYGTYEATNMTTLRGWTWEMVIVDTLWGIALTALTALVGYYAAPFLGYGR
ncbi:MAG: DUF2177 family protein [Pseudomonadota bacterium]